MSEHGEDNVGGIGEGGRGIGEMGTLGLEVEGFGRRAGIDGEGVAGGEEARGHG